MMKSRVIIERSEMKQIVSKKDPSQSWNKLVVVCDTMEEPSKKIVFESFGANSATYATFDLSKGNIAIIEWEPKCNEVNGNWFTALDIQSITLDGVYTGGGSQSQGSDLFGASENVSNPFAQNQNLPNDNNIEVPSATNENPFGPPDNNEYDGLPF